MPTQLLEQQQENRAFQAKADLLTALAAFTEHRALLSLVDGEDQAPWLDRWKIIYEQSLDLFAYERVDMDGNVDLRHVLPDIRDAWNMIKDYRRSWGTFKAQKNTAQFLIMAQEKLSTVLTALRSAERLLQEYLDNEPFDTPLVQPHL